MNNALIAFTADDPAVDPLANVPKYNDGGGKLDTRNLNTPNCCVFFVTLFLPEIEIETSLLEPLTFAMYWLPDLERLTPFPLNTVSS